MIASLKGAVLFKTAEKVVLDVSGIGYEVVATPATLAALPSPGEPAFLHVAESVGMYGGGITLYGFLTPAEKGLFLTFRDCVPSTGAKKALEYLDKASKSLPDFRRAVLEKDARVLCGVFGFTHKTSERLVDALKDKLDDICIPGAERLARAGGSDIPVGAMSQALSALAALGYKPSEARLALAAVAEEHPGEALDAERVIRLALKRL